ncbi:MAG: response regulator [Bacteriovoracaceae bacterium]|nr:response regulator [Bacteriovoracaceae bacterium]
MNDENTTGNQTNNPLSKLKIAVVDDSDFSRKTMIEILEQAGCNVIGEASNAEMAVQIAHTTSVDLFIIDVVMPNISGIKLLSHLKEISDDIRAIMISSLNMENVVMDAISGGALDYITKPFEKEALISSVTKIANDMEKE